MSVGRRIDQLAKECKKLGLTVTSKTGKKFGKREYVHALQQHFLGLKYSNGVPEHLKFMLSIESPMLCFRFPDMKPEFQESVWTDPDWIAETKLNGCRMIVIYSQEEGIHFYSRNLSVKDYLPVEYTNLWLGNFDYHSLGTAGIISFKIDCEIFCPVTKVDTTKAVLSSRGVVTETNLQATAALLALNDEDSINIQKTQSILLEFYAFHLLELNGQNFMDKSWNDMHPVLLKLVQTLRNWSFNILPVIVETEDKQEFYDSIVAAGGEGVILKDRKASYHATESRHHKAWIKVKRTVSGSLLEAGMGDTLDGFVIGFESGHKDTGFEHLVGGLKIGVYLRDANGDIAATPHWVAFVSNLELEFRKKITLINPDGSVGMDSSMYNRVVEIDGQHFSARSLRLAHPRLIRFREDKSPDQCILDEDKMKELVL